VLSLARRPRPVGAVMTTTMTTPGLLETIEAQLITPRPDCRLWPGAVDRGYGRVWVDGKSMRVHRVVWELRFGPIPDDLTIDHLCRVRSCVNTDHMELVPQGENTERSWDHRITPDPTLRTHCQKGHELVGDNVRVGKSRGRERLVCRACARAQRQRTDPT
jgi:hypothetical protein